MHGEQEISNAPRVACSVIHFVFVAFVAWLYFGSGYQTVVGIFGHTGTVAGNQQRLFVMFSFSLVLFVRLLFTLFVFLKRRFDWKEFGGVIFALFVYQIIFALLGVGEEKPLDWLDVIGIALFVLGSFLNTGSEIQRYFFKQDPAHKGVLYTGGLFSLARHINYFGDCLWVTAWAILTGNIWSIFMPILITAMFLFVFIPSLTKHLKSHYGEDFDAWAKRTRVFVPFLY
jgi:protein-S-isoprenylcysteine O-methyltransferase Ste14